MRVWETQPEISIPTTVAKPEWPTLGAATTPSLAVTPAQQIRRVFRIPSSVDKRAPPIPKAVLIHSSAEAPAFQTQWEAGTPSLARMPECRTQKVTTTLS